MKREGASFSFLHTFQKKNSFISRFFFFFFSLSLSLSLFPLHSFFLPLNPLFPSSAANNTKWEPQPPPPAPGAPTAAKGPPALLRPIQLPLPQQERGAGRPSGAGGRRPTQGPGGASRCAFSLSSLSFAFRRIARSVLCSDVSLKRSGRKKKTGKGQRGGDRRREAAQREREGKQRERREETKRLSHERKTVFLYRSKTCRRSPLLQISAEALRAAAEAAEERKQAEEEDVPAASSFRPSSAPRAAISAESVSKVAAVSSGAGAPSSSSSSSPSSAAAAADAPVSNPALPLDPPLALLPPLSPRPRASKTPESEAAIEKAMDSCFLFKEMEPSQRRRVVATMERRWVEAGDTVIR